MNKEELKKEVELELQWLRYYGLREDREKYDPKVSAYEQLRSIGYTKRVVPLAMRCGFCRVTTSSPITKDTVIEDLEITANQRSPENNVYTALDVWSMKFPEDHAWLKESLQ